MSIAQLQAISLEELLSVLADCSEQLFLVSQESNSLDCQDACYRAERAKEYLLYVLHKKSGTQVIH